MGLCYSCEICEKREILQLTEMPFTLQDDLFVYPSNRYVLIKFIQLNYAHYANTGGLKSKVRIVPD